MITANTIYSSWVGLWPVVSRCSAVICIPVFFLLPADVQMFRNIKVVCVCIYGILAILCGVRRAQKVSWRSSHTSKRKLQYFNIKPSAIYFEGQTFHKKFLVGFKIDL